MEESEGGEGEMVLGEGEWVNQLVSPHIVGDGSRSAVTSNN